MSCPRVVDFVRSGTASMILSKLMVDQLSVRAERVSLEKSEEARCVRSFKRAVD